MIKIHKDGMRAEYDAAALIKDLSENDFYAETPAAFSFFNGGLTINMDPFEIDIKPDILLSIKNWYAVTFFHMESWQVPDWMWPKNGLYTAYIRPEDVIFEKLYMEKYDNSGWLREMSFPEEDISYWEVYFPIRYLQLDGTYSKYRFLERVVAKNPVPKPNDNHRLYRVIEPFEKTIIPESYW